jgi:hypothetical protein
MTTLIEDSTSRSTATRENGMLPSVPFARPQRPFLSPLRFANIGRCHGREDKKALN